MSNARSKIITIISVLFLLIATLQISRNLYLTLNHKNLIDFLVYYGAVEKYINGQNPYIFLYGEPTPGIPFIHPPSTIIPLLFLKLFSVKVSQVIFIILSFIMFWVTFYIIIKTLKINIPLYLFIIILALITQTYPLKNTLILGQINLIILGLSFASLFYYIKSKELHLFRENINYKFLKRRANIKHAYFILSLVLLSIAISIKLFPIYVLPLFIIMGEYLYVFGVISIFILLNFVTSFSLSYQYYYEILPNILTEISVPRYYDQSVFAVVYRIFGNENINTDVTAIFLLILYFYIILKFRKIYFPCEIRNFVNNNDPSNIHNLFQSRKRLLVFSFSLIFGFFSVASSYSWYHHLVFAYPLLFIIYLQYLNRNIPTFITVNTIFLIIWVLLNYYIKNENDELVTHPILVSSQGLVIILINIWGIIRFNFFRNSLKTLKTTNNI